MAKILIIDDNRELITLLESRLQATGFETASAEDVNKGTALIDDVKPDLIILDVMLPGTDGTTFCANLKTDQNYKHIPIIILSAKDTDMDKEIGHIVRCDAYIIKPVEPDQLINVIQDLLQ